MGIQTFLMLTSEQSAVVAENHMSQSIKVTALAGKPMLMLRRDCLPTIKMQLHKT